MPNDALSKRMRNYREDYASSGSFDKFILLTSTAWACPVLLPPTVFARITIFSSLLRVSRSCNCLKIYTINACSPCKISSLILASSFKPILSNASLI